MSDLSEILMKQEVFEGLFVDFERIRRGDLDYLDETADYLATALAREAFEFRDEFNWKVSKSKKPHDRKKQIGEAIDCFIFSLNLMLVLGLSADEVKDAFIQKSIINWERQIAEGSVKAAYLFKQENLDMHGLP